MPDTPAAEEAYRLSLSTVLRLGTGANWEAIRDRAEDLVGQVQQLNKASRRLLTQRQEMAAERFAWQERGDRAEARVRQLEAAASVDRATALREEAARIRAHCPDHLDADSADGSWMVCHCAVADDLERRLAVEAQKQTETCRNCKGSGLDPRYNGEYACPDCPAEEPAVEARDGQTAFPTPCGPAPDRCDAEAGEPCAVHEREQAHAEGEHCFCGPECDKACTCGSAGDAFVPIGHYADCPQYQPAVTPQTEPACPDPIECSHEAALGQARETNRRLNLRAQKLEAELATYRRAVAQWEVSKRGTYVPLRTIAAIAKAAGRDIETPQWLLHYQRVEQAEAALQRVHNYLTSQVDAYPNNYPVAVPVADVLSALNAPASTVPVTAQSALTPCTCRQAVHAREHKNLTVPNCPWCAPTPNIRPNRPAAARTVEVHLPDQTTNDNAAQEPGP